MNDSILNVTEGKVITNERKKQTKHIYLIFIRIPHNKFKRQAKNEAHKFPYLCSARF